MTDGVRLWELSTGQEVSFLPLQTIWSVFFQPDGHELLTCGPVAGLQRWTIEKAAGASEIRLGPPHRIPLPIANPLRAAQSRDGGTVGVVSDVSGQALLLDLATESVRGEVLPHPSGCYVALSRDGKWMATAGWHSRFTRLWDGQNGKLLKEWPEVAAASVFFTPDSRNLIISRSDGFTFYDLDTFQIVRQLRSEVHLYPGYVAFSPDEQLMALDLAPGVIQLKEVATGRTVAKLEDPFGDRASWMSFTPDGTELVVAARYANLIHVWDLRAIRSRLKTMGLDWDWSEFPPAGGPEASRSRFADPPLKIQVISDGKPGQ